MKASIMARSLELAKLAAKVGFKEMRSGDLKSRFEQAKLIANSLSNLKGAAMKAGQLLSLELDSYFPPEAIEVLSQLQNAAVAHPLSEMESILYHEFSSMQRAKIKMISSIPIGVASIGQVHRAKINNRDVVLKIQYPGVSDSIDSDLKILKTLASSFCHLTGRKMNLEPLFLEFRNVLEQEVNYQAEAEYQKTYGAHVRQLNSIPSPGGQLGYQVPEVIEEFSTAKILTSSFESGQSLRSWIAAKPSKGLRHRLALAVLDLYFHEFFQWGLVQTDPNWGNFLINQNKDDFKLVLLDFGATRKYTPDFIKNYIKLLRLASKKDAVSLRRHAIEFELIDSRESTAAFKAFEDMLSTSIRPFFVNGGLGKNFDFSDVNHALQSQTAAKALAEELIYSAPPYQLIFLHRKLAGVYSILKALDVQLDISSYWEKMSELSSRKL
jgi:aarF domain-containing kinase